MLALLLYANFGLALWLWLIQWTIRASHASVRRAIAASGRPLLYSVPGLLVLAIAKGWWQFPDWTILILAGAGGLFYYTMLIQEDRSLLDLLTSVLNRK